METFHYISNEHLSIDRVREIVEKGYKLALSEESKAQIIKCREYLNRKTEVEKEPIYGVTTGFGSLCNISISTDQLTKLQENLIMSHACGCGDRVPNNIVKMMLLLKVQSLSYGYSGVQLESVERLIAFYNNDVYPIVYQLGSLGASGDLAPLAHLSLPIIGLGEVNYCGEDMKAEEINKKFGWEPVQLMSKEGLALLNGTQFMGAYSVWAVINAKRLSAAADVIGAISLEGFDGRISPFHPSVHNIRPHKGQIDTASRIIELTEGSELINRPKKQVQDPYSFRCMPQVHGATKDTIAYVESVVTTEINSTTDNPTVVPDEDIIISAGNFHGQPLALVMDFLAIAVAELGSISGQRTYQLIAGKHDLPSFLVAKPGLNSGFMIPQYSAASIVSQNKQLCTPASIDSIESSQGQEDHVSMGANAATKCYRVICNTERILAIELMNGTQALEFRRPAKSSAVIEDIVAKYRTYVPFVEVDRVLYNDIHNSIRFMQNEL